MNAEEQKDAAAGAAQQKGVATLTPEEIMGLDLIFTKERAAKAEERLAVINLREAQMQLMEAAKSKAVLLARLGDRLGGQIKNAKIVGKNQLAYELE